MTRGWLVATRNECLPYLRQRLPATPPAALQRQETSPYGIRARHLFDRDLVRGL